MSLFSFQRGNASSQCNTPKKSNSEGFMDIEQNTQQFNKSNKNTKPTPSLPALPKPDTINQCKTTPTITKCSSSTIISPNVSEKNLIKNKLSKSLSNTALIADQSTTSPTTINQLHEENLSKTYEQVFSSNDGNKSFDSSRYNQYQKKNFNDSLTNNPTFYERKSLDDSLQLSSPINHQQQRKNVRKSIQYINDVDNNVKHMPGVMYHQPPPHEQITQQNNNEDLQLSFSRYSTPNRSFENRFKSNTSTPIRKFNRSNDNNTSTVSNMSSPSGGGMNNSKNRNTSLCLGDFISSPRESPNQTRQKNRYNKNFKDVQSSSTFPVPFITVDNHNRSPLNNINSSETRIGNTNSMNKPKKRVQPTPVIQRTDGTSSSMFSSPAFHMENNILNISKDEILDKSNCQILKDRVKLKTEKNIIAKEFESELMADKQNFLHLKYIQENLTNNSGMPSKQNNIPTNLSSCQTVGNIATTTTNNIKRKIDFTKITNRHALNRFIEIHSAIIELNLTTNILNEMSYLINFLNYSEFDEFTISDIVVATDTILPIEMKVNDKNKVSDDGNGGGNFSMTNISSSSYNPKENSTINRRQISSSAVGEKEKELTSEDVNSENIIENTHIDPKLINHMDDSICSVTDSDKLHIILKNFLNCLYYARGVLDKQKHLLALLDVTTLRVVLDNEHLDIFNKDLKEFLNTVYQRKLQLDSMKSNHETSFKICNSTQTVFYQQENDTKNNFPSEREFLAFKKQRDMFYIILKIWETKHLNHTWNFHAELGPKIQSLLNVMENPINMAHLAKLFTSQLIISSNFSESPSDLETILPNIDLSKLSKLHQRLVTPSHFSVDYQFPENQAFFKDFLLTSNSVIFSEQLKIIIIAELVEMNNSSYEVINLSNHNNMNNDDDDEVNQRYKEYVVRPDIISTMRVLSKFLGLLMSRPFQYQGNRNSVVDNRQIELRDMLQPEFDLIKILDKATIDRKLLITIPWIVQYLSMLDHVTIKLSYYRRLMKNLYELYMNMIFSNDLQMRPTSIFILRTCLGWLFDNLNISEGYFQYRQEIYPSTNKYYQSTNISNNDTVDKIVNKSLTTSELQDNNKMHQIIIHVPSSHVPNELNENNMKILMTHFKKHEFNNEYHCKLVKVPSNSTDDDHRIDGIGKRQINLTSSIADTLISCDKIDINRSESSNVTNINKSFDPLLEGILNVSCPFLADFRVSIMPMKSSKCVSRTGRYRHITTKITLESPLEIASNVDDDMHSKNENSFKNKISQNSDTQTKLIEAFLHSQSLSVRRIVEFVIERTTSAVIKDYQMEILVPSKSKALEKINEINSTELKTIINEMHKIFSETYNDAMLKWDKEIPKMIKDRVKKSMDALLPNETLEAVKKTCLAIITKKCQLKANDWHLANLYGIDFYSKDIPADAEKLLKNNYSIRKPEQIIPATILEIDISKPKMSSVFAKLQFSLHFTNQRPELVNEQDLLKLCDELFITINSHKLPTSFFRVVGVMTLCLVQNLILRHNDLLTNNQMEKFIKIWLCDGLKCFIQLPNFEIDDMLVTKLDENIGDITFNSVNIFDGLLSESYLQLILHKTGSSENYSEILVILLKYKLLNINYLNNKFMKLLKLDWKQDEYKKLTLILETITQKAQQIESNENDVKSILFMEMLTDLIKDIDEF